MDTEAKRSSLKVPLGKVVATPGVREVVPAAELALALARHARGDWGDVKAEDWEENEVSVTEGYRVLSAYRTKAEQPFWVITEADRSVTTVLLPSEY